MSLFPNASVPYGTGRTVIEDNHVDFTGLSQKLIKIANFRLNAFISLMNIKGMYGQNATILYRIIVPWKNFQLKIFRFVLWSRIKQRMYLNLLYSFIHWEEIMMTPAKHTLIMKMKFNDDIFLKNIFLELWGTVLQHHYVRMDVRRVKKNI